MHLMIQYKNCDQHQHIQTHVNLMYYKQPSPQNALYYTKNLHICISACCFCFFIVNLQFV